MAPDPAGTSSLAEKPVLEWTAEDWARWIGEPPPVSRPAPEIEFLAKLPSESTPAEIPSDVDRVDATIDESSPVAESDEAPSGEEDATGVWSIALDEPEDDDARWWSSVAGLPESPPITPLPVQLEGAVASPPPVSPPPVSPPPSPWPSPSPPSLPPRPTGGDVLPAAAPRSQRLPSGGHALDSRDTAVRVRAGLSLLGVSVLVGAVAAGLITVAIFMAAVVLRRALG